MQDVNASLARDISPLTRQAAFLCMVCAFASCADPAQRVVDEAIQEHGGKAFHSFTIEFDFRNRHYSAHRDGGNYVYTRAFTDTTGNIKDVLDNNGLTRYRNDAVVDLPEERKQAFTRSVNSVIYFMLLPYGLNDKAVNKEWLGETVIRGEPYHEVRVTFDQEGGGEDHEDVFLYWFHTENKTMDYFSYSYKTDGGGVRFREAINPQRVGGILFQDYVNYKPHDETLPVDSLKAMFISNKLQVLSEIRLENVSVENH